MQNSKRILFKSQSTFTLLEDISIRDQEDKMEPYATGKINAKVNEPAIKMPSIESLKNNESDLQFS